MLNIISLIDNIQKLIFNHIGENYSPILRLVCKKWHKLLEGKNYRCSLIKLIKTASLSLLQYLDQHELTDYSNYKYFIDLCQSQPIPFELKKKKLEYLKTKGTPLSEHCYSKAICINDINTIQWLYDNLCIIPKGAYLCHNWIYNDDLIVLLEKLGIMIGFNFFSTYRIPEEYIESLMNKPNLITKRNLALLVYKLGYVKYIESLYIKEIKNKLLLVSIYGGHLQIAESLMTKYNAKLLPIVWIYSIIKGDISIFNWLHKYHLVFNDLNYVEIFKNKNLNIRQWFLDHGYFNEHCPWKIAILTLDVELCQWLWDNNIHPNSKNIKNTFENALIYPAIIKVNIKIIYDTKQFYQIFNWCNEHNMIRDTLDISILIQFNDIELLDWCFQKGYKFNANLYIKTTKYGSRKILDWLWDHNIKYDPKINKNIYKNIIKCGCKQMFQWFIDKKIENFKIDDWSSHNSMSKYRYNTYIKDIYKEWLLNPNHQLLEYIIPNLNIGDTYLLRYVGFTSVTDLRYLNLKSIQYLNDKSEFNLYNMLNGATKFLRTDIITWIIEEDRYYQYIDDDDDDNENNNLTDMIIYDPIVISINLKNIDIKEINKFDIRLKNWAIQHNYL